ncbi:hypothetical protein APY04_0225 [Hyphomicrobium sulfonivorans]|uniref:Uncharacterized protein n=1 Tax=Hyphomicrobium sulfonivorans TaxID=121290 RepID=A0A109BPS0_HYPSL|nr:hypothetical protein APY04_0225 [Hyphomicrobium sulfonivorans]
MILDKRSGAGSAPELSHCHPASRTFKAKTVDVSLSAVG